MSNYIIQFVNATLQIYLSLVFYSSFIKRKYSVLTTLSVSLLLALFMTIGLVFFKGSITVYLFTLLPTLALTYFFDSSIKNQLLYFSLYNAIAIISEMITATLIIMTTNIKFSELVGVPYIIGMLTSKLITFTIIVAINVIKQKKYNEYYGIGNLKALIFPISSLLIMIVQYIILKDSISDYNNTLPYILLFSYALLIVSNVFVFDYVDALYHNVIDKEKIEAGSRLIELQEKNYNELIKHNKDIAKLQHNNKHIYLGLLSEIENGNYTNATEQLKRLMDDISTDTDSSKGIINMLVNNMMDIASKYDTVIDFSYSKISNIRIPAVDVAILLGNSLENAIDACKKINGQKTVSLFISVQNENVIISVKNPTNEILDTTQLNSTKPDPHNHGYGIMSMKTIASKYNGGITFSHIDNIFTVSIVLFNG